MVRYPLYDAPPSVGVSLGCADLVASGVQEETSPTLIGQFRSAIQEVSFRASNDTEFNYTNPQTLSNPNTVVLSASQTRAVIFIRLMTIAHRWALSLSEILFMRCVIAMYTLD